MERNFLIKVQYASIYIVFFGRKILIKRHYVPTDIVFLENVDREVIRFNADCPFRKCWSKDNPVQSILFLLEMLIKGKMMEPVLSLLKILTKRKYDLTYITFLKKLFKIKIPLKLYNHVGLKKFGQETIRWNSYRFYGKFWPKHNTCNLFHYLKNI